jgi:hypothetical protein
MLTKGATFRNLGILFRYVQNPDLFPLDVLHAHNIGDLIIDFIKLAMQPLPEKRMTAQAGLNHGWIKSFVLESPAPSFSFGVPSTSLPVEQLSEELGAWTVFSTKLNGQSKESASAIQVSEKTVSVTTSDSQMLPTTIIPSRKPLNRPENEPENEPKNDSKNNSNIKPTNESKNEPGNEPENEPRTEPKKDLSSTSPLQDKAAKTQSRKLRNWWKDFKSGQQDGKKDGKKDESKQHFPLSET